MVRVGLKERVVPSSGGGIKTAFPILR